MKYKSELIKDIVDTRGHEKSSLHYESECVGTWIEEAKGAYPKLCDYESEWLNYIALNPVGEFPYVNLSDVTEATVDNVVPYAYKNAILKGSTKYRNIDTGEILDTFDETKNLELVSVEMPILTTTSKNLFNKNNLIVDGYIISNGTLVYQTGDNRNATDFIEVKPNCKYTISGIKNSAINGGKTHQYIGMYDKNKTFISAATVPCSNDNATITTAENTKYIRLTVRNDDINRLQIEKGTAATTYEPHKSNILTVNEDVELRGVGDVKDELNLLTGEMTQRIAEIVLDGSEKWERFTRGDLSTPAYRITLTTNSNKQYNTTHIRCNMVAANGQAWADGEHLWIDNYNNLTIHTDRFNSLEDFKSYINNSNLIVQYTIKESIKTVELTVVNQDGETLTRIKPIEGTMHLSTSSETIKPLFSGEIPVEAITQNLALFIEEK